MGNRVQLGEAARRAMEDSQSLFRSPEYAAMLQREMGGPSRNRPVIIAPPGIADCTYCGDQLPRSSMTYCGDECKRSYKAERREEQKARPPADTANIDVEAEMARLAATYPSSFLERFFE